MRHAWGTDRGFSLIEALLYVAIFSTFILGIAGFSSNLLAVRSRTQALLEVNEQGAAALRVIAQTLRNASLVNSPIPGNAGSSLSLVTADLATSPTVFSEDGGVLSVSEGSGNPIALTNNKVIASDVSFLNLSNPGTPNIVKIRFVLTSVALRPFTAVFEGSAALRK